MSKIAIIKTGGKQYKVKENDKIKIEKLDGEIGDSVSFNEVLLIADEEGNDINLGQPMVAGAKVEAKILKQGRQRKITIVKYKAKTRYRRKLGHRQHFTEVVVGAIA